MKALRDARGRFRPMPPLWQRTRAYRTAEAALLTACTPAQREQWERQRWLVHEGRYDTWGLVTFIPRGGAGWEDRHGWATSRALYDKHGGASMTRVMLHRRYVNHPGRREGRTFITPGFVFALCLYVGFNHEKGTWPLPGQMLGWLNYLRYKELDIVNACDGDYRAFGYR